MNEIILCKLGEVVLKGLNRRSFEMKLMSNIRRRTARFGKFRIYSKQSTIYVEPAEETCDLSGAYAVGKQVFGIIAIARAVSCPKEKEAILATAKTYLGEALTAAHSCKVESKRADKSFPMGSIQLSQWVGGELLEAYPHLKVDVHHPDIMLNIEIREEIYIYSVILPGPGGMPVGTGGKGMLLLSGGIDSPVAGYMIAKRGVKIDAVYFHAPPYTSERAKQKVVDLAKIVARYTGPIYLHVINFTDIQLYIYEKCPHEELTIIMRRYMMRIAEQIAKETECLGLITGESIGQVASQTMNSLIATNEVCELPVYRPLIGFDKQEIVEVSEKIGTYETSILPYEDCCTIFVAKHPVTKPNVKVIRRHEHNLDEKIDELVKTALETKELIIAEA